MKNINILLITLTLWTSLGLSKILPIEDFTKPSEFTNISISPDGKKIAGVMELNGKDKIAIIDIKKMKPLSAKTFGENRRIGSLSWANNNVLLMNVEKRVGYLDRKGEWDGVYSMHFDGKKDQTLFAPSSGVNGGNTFGISIDDSWPEESRKIIIDEFKAGGWHTFIYDLKSKRKIKLSEPGDKYSSSPYLSNSKKPIISTAYNPVTRNSYLYYKTPNSDNSQWKRLDLANNQEGVRVRYGGYTKDENVVYILSDHDASTIGIFKLNLATGEFKKVYRNNKVDIDGSIKNQYGEVIGFTLEPDYPQVVWVDKSDPMVAIYKGLKQNFSNQLIRIFNYSLDYKKMLFSVSSDKNPGEFYLLDLRKNTIKPLFNARGWIKATEMSEMKPITIKARDGLELNGYLTLPAGKNPKNLPLVVNPHGGPHNGSRDYWGYNPEVQLMANRGYAVLQLNFRGSGGYGSEFESAGYLHWGREMQNDLTDATLWAIDQGIADKNRICLYGGSYGGYATLQGLVREPELYKCGIGYVGVYDLKKMYSCGDTAVYGGYGKKYLKRVIGEDENVLRANSPAYNTDKIKAKVFLAHGEDDVRVPMCQLNSLVKGLKKSGVDYEVMTRDEGHGYQDPKNRLDFYTRLLSFLDENIGH